VSAAWPIGSIFLSVVATNPATLLGVGTWVPFGAGRMLVGLDAGDADFDTVEETGGAKTVTLTAAQIPGHTHAGADHNHDVSPHSHTWSSGNTHALTNNNGAAVALGSGGSGRVVAQAASTMNTQGLITNMASVSGTGVGTTGSAGGGGSHPNVPPYITVYMWKRTA